MGDTTAIAWVSTNGKKGSTWNPIGGTDGIWICQKVSPGCEPCYASERNLRYASLPFAEPGQELLDTPRLKEHLLREPYKWREGRKIFPGSMTDLWGEWVLAEWLYRIYGVALDNPQHTYIFLTKRPGRMVDSVTEAQRAGVLPDPLPSNWWMGTTVESPQYLWRATVLKAIHAQVRWLSLEPLYLEATAPWPMNDPRQYDGIGWHVVGGVSGVHPFAKPRYLVERCEWGEHKLAVQRTGRCARCNNTQWAPKPGMLEQIRAMRDAAHERDLPWFFKQWGGPKPESGGHLVDGVEHYEFPEVREAVPFG
jgi:protein gp37